MSLFFVIAIAIAINLDNLLIGLHLGLRQKRLPIFANVIIAIITACTTFFAAITTWLFNDKIIVTGGILAALFLIAFGIYNIIFQKEENLKPEIYNALSLKHTLILGIFLSANCIPPALCSGILNVHPIALSLFSGIFSFLSMWLSYRLSHLLSHLPISRHLCMISNIILIAVGLIELILQL